tara:strand:+ start:460 stop:1725 length:1266 start_codon:yes stop_codon:yes gene_type:complete
MIKKQTIIIGGGLQGLATANALLDRGEDVLVLERRNGTALETSFANAGMITPSQSSPWNSPKDIFKMISSIGKEDSAMLVRMKAVPGLLGWAVRFILNSSSKRFTAATIDNFNLCSYSRDLTASFRETEEINYDESTLGTAKIFRNQKSFEESLISLDKFKELGINYQALDSNSLTSLEPQLKQLSSQIIGALLFEEDETGDAYLFCKELERIVRNKGGRIHTSTEIIGLQSHKMKITGVKTSRVDIQTNKVVIAAGSWSRHLVESLGLNLHIRPVKGYSITLDLDGSNASPKLAIVDEDLHTAITPFKNRIRVAGTAEFAGFDEEIRDSRILNLIGTLKNVYPDFSSNLNYDEGHIWSGFRPMSSDGKPYIGKTKIEGLFINTGQGHLGWTMAMGSASLLADIMTNQKTAIDSMPFNVLR